MGTDIFDRLFEVIEQRRSADPERSYVAGLLHKGPEAIQAKILEEAHEVCQAAGQEPVEPLVHEICDLLFHTFVLAGYRRVSLRDIVAELERRFGTSGLTEKASRGRRDAQG